MAQFTNPYDEPPQQQPGTSGTSKLLLILGVGCGTVLLLCCGGIGLSSFLMMRYMSNAVVSEPAKVRSIAEEIAQIEVPAGLEPKMALNMKIPFMDRRMFDWALFADEKDQSVLMLMQFPEDIGADENMKMQARESMRQGWGKDAEDLEISESETREVQINGQEGTFRIAKGIGRRSMSEFWQVDGRFQGKNGPALLLMQIKSPPFSGDDAKRVIDSIK